MIHITKGEEPKELTIYKNSDDINKSYKCFRDKDAIREALLKEQGYLCAYCMRAIGYDRSKWFREVRIEHYRCRDDFTHLQLEYLNMFAVCTCSDGLSKKEAHCDASKKNLYIHIDPKNNNHILTLRYSEGGILSTDQQFAEDVENTLGLNRSTLPTERRDILNNAILQMKIQLDRGIEKDQIISKTLHIYGSNDRDGRRRPFCGIVMAYCEKLNKLS